MRADALAILLPRLLLSPTSSVWWSSSSTKEIRERCRHFLAGEWWELFIDSQGYAPADFDPDGCEQREDVLRDRRRRHEQQDERTDRQRTLDYAVQQVSDGQVGKAAATLLSAGKAPASQATADKLAAMQFPARPSQRPAQNNARTHKPSRSVLTAEQVLAGVGKAPRGSCAGPSGWRYEHVKAACEHDEGRRGIVIIVSRIAEGEFGTRPSTAHNAHIISESLPPLPHLLRARPPRRQVGASARTSQVSSGPWICMASRARAGALLPLVSAVAASSCPSAGPPCSPLSWALPRPV